MKKLLAKDGFLKILSVIIAILIWVYIIIVIDPSVEIAVRDIPIQFVGVDTLEARELSVVSESATTVNIKVKGSRKRMGSYDLKNVIAKVDLSGVYSAGNSSLPIDIVVPFENTGVSSKNPYSVDVVTEKTLEKKVNVDVQTTGNVADGFMPGDIKTEPSSVEISGAESVVEQVSRIVVDLDYGDADVDIDKEAEIRLYGVDGKEILNRDALADRIKKNVSTVKIHCPILKVKEVGIALNFGDSNWLIDTSKYKTNPEKIEIYGDNGVTANLSSIQTEPILPDKFSDKEKIKVKLMIPDGVKVIGNVSEVEVIANQN